jgi:predicted DCC family thiol-disulfide oxidoreductase YuxK
MFILGGLIAITAVFLDSFSLWLMGIVLVNRGVDDEVYRKIRRLRNEKKVNVSAFLNEKIKEILEQEFNL